MKHGPGPHFVCIGPGNCATTWLADHLKLHWDIWMPPIQEASYLSTRLQDSLDTGDLEWTSDPWSVIKRVIRNKSFVPWRDRQFYAVARELALSPGNDIDLAGYRRLFAAASGKLTGDVAPVYASFTVDEIKRFLPVLEDTRVFVIARDPVQRFWAAMSRYFRYGTLGDVDYGSIGTAQRLFADPERSTQHFPTKILDRWEQGLGRGRVRVFFFDEIVERPTETYRDIITFIGADMRYRLPVLPMSYNRKAKDARPAITDEAREWVSQAFQPELAACAERFGGHAQRWLERHRITKPAAASAAAQPMAALN